MSESKNTTWKIGGNPEEMFKYWKKIGDYLISKGEIVSSFLDRDENREERRISIYHIPNATVKNYNFMAHTIRNFGQTNVIVFSSDEDNARKILEEILAEVALPISEGTFYPNKIKGIES